MMTKRRSSRRSNSAAATWMLVCDLDGTLLGDEVALLRFRDWLESCNDPLLLAYATGRTARNVAELVADDLLPGPDYVIGSIGAELIDCATEEPIAEWPRLQGAWSITAVRAVVAAQSAARTVPVEMQPAEFQTPHKVSYFWDEASASSLSRLAAALAAARVDAELCYSCNRFLDIVPRDMNKGTAARWLAQRHGIATQRVIACGDSGNDLPMFCLGFCGVAVANAQQELLNRDHDRLYQSSANHAAGVLDGILHWQRHW